MNRWHPPPEAYSASIRGSPSNASTNHALVDTCLLQPVPTSPLTHRQLVSVTDIPVHPDLLRARSPSPGLVDADTLALHPTEPHQPISPQSVSINPDNSKPSPTRKRVLSFNDDSTRKEPKTNIDGALDTVAISQRVSDATPGLASSSASSGDVKPDAPPKVKSTRGSRACTVCRRLKMRCVDAESPPCKRCRLGKHQCVFEESQRGKKGTKRTDILAKNLQTVEEKLDGLMSKIQTRTTASFPSPTYSSQMPFDVSQEPEKPNASYSELGCPPRGLEAHSTCQLAPNASSSLPQEPGTHSWRPDSTDQRFSSGMTHLSLTSLANQALLAASGPTVALSASVSSSSTPLVTESGASNHGASLMNDRHVRQSHPPILHQIQQPNVANRPVEHPKENGNPPPLHRFAALPDFSRPSSPRLHSLPDNTLNPLGLLAEASLRNRHDRHRSDRSSSGSHRRNSSIRSAPAHPRGLPALEQHDTSHYNISEEHDPIADVSSPCSSTSSCQEPLLATAEQGSSQHHSGNKHKRKVGVANQSYFQPAPRNILPLRRIVIEQRVPPSLLTDKILSNEEAVELFQIFFDNCNPHCCILERDFHTPTMIGSRSPFLFTAICAVASRYYEKRQELHLNCLQTAKRIAFDVMVKGYKSVEVVQAFLLLSLWNQPAERFEEDRTWAFSGIAIRMAIDLNLHRKTTAQVPLANSQCPKSAADDLCLQHQEAHEREILNRERTWLYCFILDRSLSAQMGKPYSIREDFIIRSSKNWHKHRCSVPDDSGLTAMVDLHRIHSRILDTLYSDTCSNSGLNANLDYSLLMKTFSQSLDQWIAECTMRIGHSVHDVPGGYRHSMKDFYYNYYRLFTMSFMLQHTLENPDKEIELPQVYVTCYDAATRVITIARDHLGPLGALRYAPDNQFVYIAYAAVFLLKLIRPQFQSFCDALAVRRLVHDCTVLLEDISVDETHTPALYAAFLKVLLNSKKEPSPCPVETAPSQPPTNCDLTTSHVEGLGPPDNQDDRGSEANWSIQTSINNLPRDSVPINFLVHSADPIPSLPFPTAPLDGPLIPLSAAPAAPASFDQQPFDVFVENTHPMDDYFVDSLLKDGGFWDSMLMPGYSGPLDALSGGVGFVSQFGNGTGHDQSGFGFTPTASGRATPNPLGNCLSAPPGPEHV